jgi:serine/threonine protein phosphatase 1
MTPVLPFLKTQRVLRLAANQMGRDFVVGDIHGAYTSVLAAMAESNFDKRFDRILSVGDLIDRGPDSWRCAKFLAQPYVYAVRGNHEDMLLQLYENGIPSNDIIEWAAKQNGFGWWLTVPETQRLDIVAAIAKLPTILEVDTPRGLIGLVHADVPKGMDWATFTAAVSNEDEHVLETALWGRNRILSENEDGVCGIGRVFVGHTPQWNGLRRFGNVYAVDSGAIFAEMGIKSDGRLSFVDAMCKTGVLIEQRTTRLIDIREDVIGSADAMTPFGHYVRT